MKKTGIILTALILTLALCACGDEMVSVGIIGGEDGPTAILVTDGEDSSSYTVTDEGVTKNETETTPVEEVKSDSENTDGDKDTDNGAGEAETTVPDTEQEKENTPPPANTTDTKPETPPPASEEKPTVEPDPPAATEEPPAESTASPKEIAESYIDKPLSGLVAQIGEPAYSDYAPSCLGDGDDGELSYDGFTVYTYREGDKETVTYVE